VSDRPNFPLADIIVLDVGQVFQGPYATLLMAKAGADVIKIEPPHGEPLRRRTPPGKSTTSPIAMPIPGTSHCHRLEENAAAVSLKISADTEDAPLKVFARVRAAGCATRKTTLPVWGSDRTRRSEIALQGQGCRSKYIEIIAEYCAKVNMSTSLAKLMAPNY
jgi:hypothetical protein